MVERVQQRRRERDRAPLRTTERREHQRCPEPEDDDPDVLDRVKRQQSLELVLKQRIQHAADRGQRADPEQQQADPQRGGRRPLKQHAYEPVQRELDHHPRHQRGHVGRRQRVRTRQPRMQRHRARLRPEPEHRRDGDQRTQAAVVKRSPAHRAERAVIGQHQHARPHPDPAEVRDREIREHIPPRPLIVTRNQDHGRRQQRHQLPERQERGHVTGRHQTDQRQAERAAERDDRGLMACLEQRIARIHRGRHGGQREHHEEEPAQPIDPERGRKAATKRRAERVGAEHHGRASGTDQRHPRRLDGQRHPPPSAAQRQQRTTPDRSNADGASELRGAHVARASSSPSSSRLCSRFAIRISRASASSFSVRRSLTRQRTLVPTFRLSSKP